MTETDYVKDDIVYVIQKNESIHLSDDSNSYIYNRIEQREKELQQQIDYWKNAYYEVRIPNRELYWNELKQWLKRESGKWRELAFVYIEVRQKMKELESGKSLR